MRTSSGSEQPGRAVRPQETELSSALQHSHLVVKQENYDFPPKLQAPRGI